MSHSAKKRSRAAVQISENRKSINIDEPDSSISLSVQSRKRSHTSEEFIRFLELTDDGWENRQNFLWCCTLMGTGNDSFPHMFDALLSHSGGIYLILFPLFTALLGLPMVYMEVFLGRYTRVTNCQMYRMAPIFFGFCFLVILINVFYQPLHVAEDTQIMVNLLKLLVDPDINEKCLLDDQKCYDYKLHGSLKNQTCRRSYLSLKCNGKTVMYPMQYQFWAVYKDATSGLYPYWQLVTAVVISWGIILVIVMKKVEVIGKLVRAAFLFHLGTLTALLLMALLNGGAPGFKILLTFDISNATFNSLITMIWAILFKLGLIIPSGYMTFSAYARFESNIVNDSAIIVMGNVFLNIYYLAVYCAVAGVIAAELEVDPSYVLIVDRGIYLTMVPEMLTSLEISNFYLICYYASSWLFEIIKIAFYIHMLILNMYDYFPLTKNFETYIWVFSCIILCLLSVIYCHQHIYTYFIPIYWAMYLLIGLGILIATEGVMVFYVYGVSRLCDDIHFTTGEPTSKFWKSMWYTAPAIQWLLVLYTTFTVVDADYGKWLLRRKHVQWIYCAVYFGSLIVISIIALIMSIAIKSDTPNLLLYLMKPQFFWGPIDKEERKSRKLFYPDTYIRSQPTTKSEEYAVPEQVSSENDEECKIEKIHNDKIFFNNIGIYTDVITLNNFSKKPKFT